MGLDAPTGMQRLPFPTGLCEKCRKHQARYPMEILVEQQIGPMRVMTKELLLVCNRCHHEIELENMAEELR